METALKDISEENLALLRRKNEDIFDMEIRYRIFCEFRSVREGNDVFKDHLPQRDKTITVSEWLARDGVPLPYYYTDQLLNERSLEDRISDLRLAGY